MVANATGIYPSEWTDDALQARVIQLTRNLQDQQYNINSVLQFQPVIQVGLNGLDRRRQVQEASLNREAAQQQLSIGKQSLELGEQTKKIGDQQLAIGEQSIEFAKRSYKIAIISTIISVISLAVAVIAVWISLNLAWTDASDEVIASKLDALQKSMTDQGEFTINGNSRLNDSLKGIRDDLSKGIVVKIDEPAKRKTPK